MTYSVREIEGLFEWAGDRYDDMTAHEQATVDTMRERWLQEKQAPHVIPVVTSGKKAVFEGPHQYANEIRKLMERM